jgi:hypothetical protein
MTSPQLRALVLRLFGLLVFALVALGAAGFVAFAVAGADSPLAAGAESFSTWVDGPLLDWAAVLVGVGLVLLSAVFAVIMVPHRPSTLQVVWSGTRGRTMVDLPSVAQALETHLRARVDPKITVGVKRRCLRVVTPYAPSRPFDLVDRAGISVREQLQKLGLADVVRYEVATGRETKRRVQ